MWTYFGVFRRNPYAEVCQGGIFVTHIVAHRWERGGGGGYALASSMVVRGIRKSARFSLALFFGWPTLERGGLRPQHSLPPHRVVRRPYGGAPSVALAGSTFGRGRSRPRSAPWRALARSLEEGIGPFGSVRD